MLLFSLDEVDRRQLSEQEKCLETRLSKKSFVGFQMAREEGRPLATSSLAVGHFAAKKGSLRSPRGRLVTSLSGNVHY